MRSLASVPIAENISAYLTTCSAVFFEEAGAIFRYLQKYSVLSMGACRPPQSACIPAGEQASREVLSLPVYPELPDFQQERIVQVISQFSSSRM